ncbi:MAG: UDP-N-acetylmuramoyl-tripeptide--D-alanyl-D-alanine ligase, partial [Kiritimatiellia bacterium]
MLQLGSPVVMWLTSLVMKPVEDAVNRSFLNDARRIVRSIPGLKIVGITGSYGKTSTKHVLAELLGESRNVLHTPGSFNTPLVVTRTIREHLRPSHEIFIAEMGARQPGNIRELCELTPPHAGILTAIGEQHLETFGTLEALQRTKWELAEALPADGFLVCNVDHAAVRDILARAPIRARVVRCGMTSPEADHRAENLSVTASGLSFDLVRPGHPPLRLTTRLLGRHNVINITLAAVTALELGITPESIRIAVSGLRPVPHRLELKRNASGFLILDNAFSSNPAGAASALEMLKLVEGGRKVLITPGMVELGTVEHACNKTFGVQAAAAADVVVLVGRQRAVAIHEGLREAGFPEDRVVVAEDLKAASAWMHANLKPGDV